MYEFNLQCLQKLACPSMSIFQAQTLAEEEEEEEEDEEEEHNEDDRGTAFDRQEAASQSTHLRPSQIAKSSGDTNRRRATHKPLLSASNGAKFNGVPGPSRIEALKAKLEADKAKRARR